MMHQTDNKNSSNNNYDYKNHLNNNNTNNNTNNRKLRNNSSPSSSSSLSCMIKDYRPGSEPASTSMTSTSYNSNTIDQYNYKASKTLIREPKEHLFKILVIGELGTGKTSFIKRYVHQYFSPYYRATIGVDFALKVLNWDDNVLIRLQLWDIAGQERFGNMTRIYYKEAVGAFLVFDVSAPSSFNAVLKWKHDLDTKVCMADGEPIPCLLLANKCDATKEGIASDPELLDKFSKENNFCGWYYTSAKEDTNIEESAKFLVEQILQRYKHFAVDDDTMDSNIISLKDVNYHKINKSNKCNC